MPIDTLSDNPVKNKRDIHSVSEERLALALYTSHMGLWEWNAINNELLWTDELKKLFGLEPDENITYERYFELIYPADRQKIRTAIDNALKNATPYTLEHRVALGDGSIHWVICTGKAFVKNGKVIRMLGTTMNIDDRKRAEINARESESRFRNMADAAPVLIWVTDTNRSLTYLNKTWRNFTGRTISQDLGDGWQDAIHPDDLKHALLILITAFNERETFRLEFRIRRHDGKYFWMLNKGAPRYSADGDFLGYVGSIIEVEEIKSSMKRQLELEEINKKLKLQSEQLIELSQSKDEFISLASHQLRTPATGVKQYIGMILQGYNGEITKSQQKMLETAYESNERQLRIIDDLLKVAHVDAGKVSLVCEKTNLRDLINDVIAEQGDNFTARKQKISFLSKHKQITAFVDSEKMRMVLENLIDNASKYTPEGKDITISLSGTQKDFTISVADTGVGIAKKDMDKLYKKFSRIENRLSTLVGGTGLGLYWVRKIVDLHKGVISVKSTRGKGTIFTVTMPKKIGK